MLPINRTAMPIDVRPMTIADIPDALALWAATEGVEIAEGDSPAEIRRYLERNPALSTVAVEAGRVVGAVMCGHDGRRGFVYHLAVAVDLRGRGIARRIMERSLEALKAEGIRRVLLLVAADNTGGRQFWEREGWESMPFAQPMGIDL